MPTFQHFEVFDLRQFGIPKVLPNFCQQSILYIENISNAIAFQSNYRIIFNNLAWMIMNEIWKFFHVLEFHIAVLDFYDFDT